MNLSTTVKIEKLNFIISHKSKILSLGSCFSNTIAGKMNSDKFDIILNPSGQLYNPISISQTIKRALDNKKYSKADLIKINDKFVSLDHHSLLCQSSETETLNSINQTLNSTHIRLKELDTLIITFGTAFAFSYKIENRIITNCHKLPTAEFDRVLLSPDQIYSEFKELFELLLKQNKNLNIILTISPVRHLRDSAHKNQISKSHLFVALNMLDNHFKNLYYFPSYEILMDELRDYRFYAEDMAHLSPTAEKYIYEKFSTALFSKDSREFIKNYKTIKSAKLHKLTTSSKTEISSFSKNMCKKIERLQKRCPSINLDSDKKYFSNLI